MFGIMGVPGAEYRFVRLGKFYTGGNRVLVARVLVNLSLEHAILMIGDPVRFIERCTSEHRIQMKRRPFLI
jgi:hypothetical protein